MQLIIRAGGLSLRELFARAGDVAMTSRRVATLLKSGEVRIESPEGTGEVKNRLATLSHDLQSLSETDIADRLTANSPEDLEIVPTAKAWRKPFTAL